MADDSKPKVENKGVFIGRKVVKSSVGEVTSDNVREVLNLAMATHNVNQAQIQYLKKYYRGLQPILDRTKDVRPEICNHVIENRANEIVTFKVGYLCGEPIQYVSRTNSGKGVEELNNMMLAEGKFAKDRDICEENHICGTAFRMVLPDKDFDNYDLDDECPFEIWTLPTDSTFVIYSTDYTCRPLAGVTYSKDDQGHVTFDVYTSKRHFRLIDYVVVLDKPHSIGSIPIIEYPANNSRIGAFEVVMPLLDALNEIESNRVDGVEQFVQAIMAFQNIDVTRELIENMREMGALQFTSTPETPADVKLLVSELNQQQTQVLVDSLYDNVLSICGMPRRTGKGSTSDTGAAVIMRDGWQDAEARAKDSEWMFKQSEYEFLKLVLRICRDTIGTDLKFSDIELKFTRRNYEAIQSKAQVLVTMLECGKIDPLLAFVHCGMFTDPEAAYLASQAYVDEQANKAADIAAQFSQSTPDDGGDAFQPNAKAVKPKESDE